MSKSIVFEVLEIPATCCVCLFCVCVWLYLKQHRVGYQDVGLNYDKVVHDKEYWRLIVSQLCHIEFLHLLFNVTALWSLGTAERNSHIGSFAYLRTSFLLLLLSGLMCLGIYYALIESFHRDSYRQVTSVGYSGVIFGWMTLLATRKEVSQSYFTVVGMVHVPMALAPWASLLTTQLFVPKASFLGHLSGIFAGLALATPFLDALTPYWTACLAMWAVVGVLVGMARSGTCTPYVRMINDADDVETGGAALIT